MDLLNRYEKLLNASAAALKASSVEDVPARCAANVQQIKDLMREKSELETELASSKTGDIMANAVDVNGVRAATVKLTGVPKAALRTMGDEAKDKWSDAVVLFVDEDAGSTALLVVCGKDAVAKGADAGKIIRETAAITGGKGGGRADSAMGGAGTAAPAEDAVKAFTEIVGKYVK